MALERREAKLAIREAGARWVAGRTSVSDLTDDEKTAMLGVIDRREAVARVQSVAAAEAPAGATWPTEWDWRDHSGVTPVKHQRQCGACVSFATVATVESLIRLQENFTLDLSEADLHFCSSHGANCEGWWPDEALSQLQQRGVCDTACTPYTWNPPTCNNCANRNTRVVTIAGWQAFRSPDTFRVHISSYWPMIACFDVYEDFFLYECGIYSHQAGDYKGGHCVQVIGYDDDTGSWLCKNSWGSGWGMGGLFRIGYGECGIDDAMWEVNGPIGIPWSLRPKDQKDNKDNKDNKDGKDKDSKDNKDSKDRKDRKDEDNKLVAKEKETAKDKETDRLTLNQLGQRLEALTERVDAIAAELAQGRSFIQPSERPDVGEQAITDDDESS
jgi:C1A family cysteine protease